MNNRTITSIRGAGFLILGCIVALTACGKKETGGEIPKTTKAAATQIQEAFANSADAHAKQQAEILSEAMRRRQFEQAYQAINNLQNTKVEDINQVLAVENAHRRLQSDLLGGVEAGDPEAIRIWQQMKRSRRD